MGNHENGNLTQRREERKEQNNSHNPIFTFYCYSLRSFRLYVRFLVRKHLALA